VIGGGLLGNVGLPDAEHPMRYMVLFWAFLLAGLIQAFAALISENRVLHRIVDDRTLRRGIARRLGEFLAEGDQLQKPANVLDHARREKWIAAVEVFMVEEPSLGSDYVARFRNGAGIPITIPDDITGEAKRWWAHIHTRRARLDEFISELLTSASFRPSSSVSVSA
jgi:hypothetical protein